MGESHLDIYKLEISRMDASSSESISGSRSPLTGRNSVIDGLEIKGSKLSTPRQRTETSQGEDIIIDGQVYTLESVSLQRPFGLSGDHFSKQNNLNVNTKSSEELKLQLPGSIDNNTDCVIQTDSDVPHRKKLVWGDGIPLPIKIPTEERSSHPGGDDLGSDRLLASSNSDSPINIPDTNSSFISDMCSLSCSASSGATEAMPTMRVEVRTVETQEDTLEGRSGEASQGETPELCSSRLPETPAPTPNPYGRESVATRTVQSYSSRDRHAIFLKHLKLCKYLFHVISFRFVREKVKMIPFCEGKSQNDSFL